MRSPLTPASPPKKPEKMRDEAAINSPIPREIMANTVPALRVEKLPMNSPANRPKAPPTKGIQKMEKDTEPDSIRIRPCTARNPPSPKYTAWPNDSIPPCPSSML